MKLFIFIVVFFYANLNQAVSSPATYKEIYLPQLIDHFNFQTYGDDSFKQRVLYNATWWKQGEGPIFFYTGNEMDIVYFWNNTGFIFEIAPKFEALVVFAEHRFYGKSLPFGNESFEYPHVGLLTIEQALADYAVLIPDLKKRFGAESSSVIVFGGSYGGMLSAYMRFKYPNIVHGAIASSAPILQTAGLVAGSKFFEKVTEDFRDISSKCENQVRTAFHQIQLWETQGIQGLQKISRVFRLCKPLSSKDDYDHFLRWVRQAFVNAAMMDYPYATSFVGSFPPFPVKVMCGRLVAAKTSVAGLRDAIGLNYNASGDKPCFDMWKEYIFCSDPTGCGDGFDAQAWDYQACTEVCLEGGTNGVTDMFPVLPFTNAMRKNYCHHTWQVTPRDSWMNTQFWGKDIQSASNIVFSNGDLDPWGPGGIQYNVSDTLVSVIVKGGAHHLDLRGSNEADPPSVVEVRDLEVEYIKKWLQEARER